MDRQTEKIRQIVRDAVSQENLTSFLQERQVCGRTEYRHWYVCGRAQFDRIAETIGDALEVSGLSPKWCVRAGPMVRKRPELGHIIDVQTNFRDGCPECVADSVYFKIEV